MMKIIEKCCRKIVDHSYLLRRYVDVLERSWNPIVRNVDNLKEGYSIIIVTDGKSEEQLKRSLYSTLEIFSGKDNYEVIVIGQNDKLPVVDKHISYIPYRSVSFMPGWITLKKNIGAFLAKYDTLVVMHDYIALCKGWLDGYMAYNRNYDVCTNRIIFLDGRRARDWTVYDYPGIGAALLPYSCFSEYIYISGAYFVVKTQFYRENPLDERRRWGEAEDVEWSVRIRKKAQIMLNKNSCCQFVKSKPQTEAPYIDSWIDRSIRLYNSLGFPLSKDNYETYVKEH